MGRRTKLLMLYRLEGVLVHQPVSYRFFIFAPILNDLIFAADCTIRVELTTALLVFLVDEEESVVCLPILCIWV